MLTFCVLLIVSILVYLNVGFLLGTYLWKIAHQAPTSFRQAIFNFSLFAGKDPYKNYDSYETKPTILVWGQGQYAAAIAFGWGPMIIAHIILGLFLILIAILIISGTFILNQITWPMRKLLKIKPIPYLNLTK
jgi:hypothetical protein